MIGAGTPTCLPAYASQATRFHDQPRIFSQKWADMMFKRCTSTRAKLLFILVALFLLSLPAGAQIDNCCFVDRLCATNDEWVNGYWAYQHNQCPAPAQPQPTASADIDNCCFVDRQCATAEDYVAGYFAFRNSQCGLPSQSNNCCFSGWQCSTDDDWVGGYWAFRYDQCNPPARAERPDQAPQPTDDEQRQWQSEWKARTQNGAKPIVDRSARWAKYRVSGPSTTAAQVCAKHPQHNWCQNPENYPEVWQRYPEIWQEIQEELSDE